MELLGGPASVRSKTPPHPEMAYLLRTDGLPVPTLPGPQRVPSQGRAQHGGGMASERSAWCTPPFRHPISWGHRGALSQSDRDMSPTCTGEGVLQGCPAYPIIIPWSFEGPGRSPPPLSDSPFGHQASHPITTVSVPWPLFLTIGGTLSSD